MTTPPQAVAVDAHGNVVVTGYSLNVSGNYDCYTAKYGAASGVLLWEQRYNGVFNGNDVPTALALDGSGNVVVTGLSGSLGGNFDYFTAKYASADGTRLWEHRYGSPATDQANAVAVDANGNVIVTGFSTTIGSNNGDFYTAK